ncbi:MAG: glycosyltransferase family 2 protein [Clostridia bacterium]|nr:glycosyltransferase family 2 protein [Clostridiales bacterium]MBQ2976371.1 glycosyltransferase family 2 protein [Clostridia bacterium]
MQPVFSVIVPCYNEEEVIRETHKRLTKTMREMGEPYEILYVDDGSRDDTAQILRELSDEDANVRAILFARNAGHQSAVTAGLDYATGDAIVIIDADLQDPPEVIPLMAEKWRNGAQVVFGQRKKRDGETAFKKITASAYYKILAWMTGGMVPRDTGDFRLVDRKAADVIRGMPEHNRFLRGMFAWAGFKQEAVLYDRDKRFAGKTEYTLKKMLKLAADGIFSFSMKPLKFITLLGLGFLGISGILFLILLIALLFGGGSGLWWIAMLMLLCTGCVLSALGIVGEYIARIYDESRGRPLYIVTEALGFEEN